MNIIADENIPYVEEYFGKYGKVELLPAEAITSKRIQSADALLIRTTTKIFEGGFPLPDCLQFVGSATIGVDHVDREYLKKRGVTFVNAPGCNARAVGEFVWNAVLQWCSSRQEVLRDHVLGIIGYGNTGKAVDQIARELSVPTLLYDPLINTEGLDGQFVTLDQLQKEASLISLHVPLTKTGPFPTFHSVDRHFLKKLKKQPLVINTSRGSVIDQVDLLDNWSLVSGALLDVWEGEPIISLEMLQRCWLATPHIAGYSKEGKQKATLMLAEAFQQYLGLSANSTLDTIVPSSRIEKNIQSEDANNLAAIIRSVYNPFDDDLAMREFPTIGNYGERFKELRNLYEYRNEFGSIRLKLETGSWDPKIQMTLERLGFELSPTSRLI